MYIGICILCSASYTCMKGITGNGEREMSAHKCKFDGPAGAQD